MLRRVGFMAPAVLLSLAPRPGFTQVFRPSLLAEMSVERPEVYLREPFVVTLSLRSAGEPISKTLTLQGLPDPSVVRFGSFQELQPERRADGPNVFDVRRFRATAVPLKTGQMPLRFTLVVESLFWGRKYEVGVTPVSVNVLPLPEEGRPADFSGAVGDFTLEATAAPTEVAVGDLVTVTMRVSGRGSLDGTSPPRIAPAPHLKFYDPKPVAQADDSRTYAQVLVPGDTNAAAIPGVTFVFFDPGRKAYRTVAAGPFPLRFTERKGPAVVAPFRPDESDATARAAGGGPEARPVERTGRRATWEADRIAAVTSLVYAGLWTVGIAFVAARGGRRRRVWILLSVTLAVALFLPYRARVLRIAAAAPEVTMTRVEAARFAPSQNAVRLFDVPGGAPVRFLDVFGRWAKIELRGNRGWVPLSSLKPR
jgi:hypothetical protein